MLSSYVCVDILLFIFLSIRIFSENVIIISSLEERSTVHRI